jgi:hypothetical protein
VSGFSRTFDVMSAFRRSVLMRFLAFAIVLLFLTERADTQEQEFLIVAGERFGLIRESTTRAELEKFFPKRLIRDGDVHLGEGICTSGTVILPETALEADIAWQDDARSRVAFVRVIKPGGRWVTSRGVRIGTSLRELERLAGKVLTFSGFDWDYGGGMEWTEPSGALRLRLGPAPNQPVRNGPGSLEIVGDRLVRSDHPLIRKLTITVEEITQSWGTHFGEKDCG